jgi:hypothetical protein
MSSFLGTNYGKKTLGENYVENHVLKRFPRDYKIRQTSDTKHQTDFQIDTPDGLTVSLEVKNWDYNVDFSETKKTRKIFEDHKGLDVCIIVSLKSSIESRHEIYFEKIGNKFLWFYPKAIDSNVEYLYPIILMSNSMSSFIKLNTSGAEDQVTELGKQMIDIFSVLNSLNEMNFCQQDLQKAMDKQNIAISRLKKIIQDLIFRMESCMQKFGIAHTRSTQEPEEHKVTPKKQKKRKTNK